MPPARTFARPFRLGELRDEAPIGRAIAGEVLRFGIEPRIKPGEIARAQRRGLLEGRPLDRLAQHVRQELHAPIARRHAAIDTKDEIGDRLAIIREHRLQEVERLVADTFEHRPRQFLLGRATGDAADQRAGMAVPVGRAEAGSVLPVFSSRRVTFQAAPTRSAERQRVRVRMAAPRAAASMAFSTTRRESSTQQSEYSKPRRNSGRKGPPVISRARLTLRVAGSLRRPPI